MKTKTTPGPWIFDEHYSLIMAADQVEVAAVHAGRGTKPKEASANAHLIAAAPEMIEALKAALLVVGNCAYCDDAEHIIRKAIAKAEGESK